MSLFLVPVAVIGIVLVSFEQFDPRYATEQTIDAEITRFAYASGKTGARIELQVKTDKGDEFYFKVGPSFSKRQGERVQLRVYRRLHSGLISYELDRHR